MQKFEGLELPLIQAMVAKEASFELSKQFILNEKVNFNPLAIKANIAKTNEALELIKIHGRFRFEQINDISDALDKVKKGLTLTAYELGEVLLHNTEIKRIIRYFRQLDEIDELRDYTDSLYYSDKIINLIAKTINDNREIRKDATPKLVNLYEKLNKIDASINDASRIFLRDNALSVQESVVYYRNNRACFLLKNSDKNKYNGFSYGSSASGQASYVEPQCLIGLNNQKNEIEQSIDEENKRILLAISLEVAKDAQHFLDNLESLMILDSIMAKANFGFENNGVMALVGGEDLYLKDIAHPLIEQESVVINTYRIEAPKRAIVISGSNTGGKTVSLKVIGLSVLMTYLGIPLIASEARLPIYDNVIDDINDSQSIVDSISTFSARLVSLNKIINDASNYTLVLIDEIASGTDPKEGEALALATIEHLVANNVTFVITTHFNGVKRYALANEKILLSSQAFDPIELKPTYKYIENSLGQSNGLDIATRYLGNQDVVVRAKAILKESENTEERLIRELEKERETVAFLKNKLASELAEQKTINQDYQNRLNLLKDNEEKIKEEAREKAEAYLIAQKKKAKAILKDIQQKDLKYHEAIKKVKELDAHLDEEEDEDNQEPVNVDDTVKVISTGQVGKLVEIKKDRATVEVNGVSIKTKLSNLRKTVAPKVENKKHIDKSFKRTEKELVLVGMRCDEALEHLSKYLDDAYGANMTQVKIVHGIGTGVLRKAVWEYLKKCKNVKNYHYGDAYDGSSAVTIVEFK